VTGTDLIQFCAGGFAVGVVFGLILRSLVSWIAKAINS